MSIEKDKFDYIRVSDIKSLVIGMADKKQICDKLKQLLISNVTSIKKANAIIKDTDYTSGKKARKEVLIQDTNNDAQSIQVEREKDIDYFYNMVLNCPRKDLDNLLLSVIIPEDALYPVLARMQKDYFSYNLLADEFKASGDLESSKDCFNEMYNLTEVMQYIKSFGSLPTEEIEQVIMEKPPVNNLIYLTSGDRCLPFDDISKIPIEYYSSINKLLTGMEYGRFSKIKSLYDSTLLQVSDGQRVRVYFRHMNNNNFLIAGVFLYTNNGKDKASNIFINKREALCKSFIANNRDVVNTDSHHKVLQLLNPKGEN